MSSFPDIPDFENPAACMPDMSSGAAPTCAMLDEVYTCMGLPSLKPCCSYWDGYMAAVTSIATSCPAALSGTFSCNDISAVCNSGCLDILFDHRVLDLTNCLANVMIDAFTEPGDNDIPGMPNMEEMMAQSFQMVSTEFESVCRHAAEISTQQCEQIVAGNFDFSELIEPYYPDFDIPDTIDMDLVIEGVTNTVDVNAITEAAKADVLAALQEAGLADFFNADSINITQDGEKLTIDFNLQPPANFEEQLKALFPADFDPYYVFSQVDVDKLPDGNDWIVPASDGMTWNDVVAAAEELVNSDVNFSTLEQSEAVPATATYSSTASGAQTQPTTYSDLGREEPAYGSVVYKEQEDPIDSASTAAKSLALGVAAVAAVHA